MKFLMIYPNSTGNTKVPLGILYILTLLKKEGHDVELFDMTFYGVDLGKHDINIRGKYLNFMSIDMEPYGIIYKHAGMADVEADLSERIQRFQPDLIGVSLTEDTSMVGIRLAGVAKEVYPRVPVLFGGVFCMTMPDFIIARKEADLVCIAEGERAVVELARRIDTGQNYDDIPTLWVKLPDGTIRKNEIAPPIALDSLPFMDLSLIDDCHLYAPMAGHVYKMLFVESQRGCPRRCAYCCNQIFLNTYSRYRTNYLRKKSIPRLIAELEYYKEKYGINFIQFTDDDFLLRTPEELRLFNDMYRERVDLPFWIQAEAWNATEEKISLVRKAGCISISMGIETGSDRIRKEVLNRKTPREITIKAFEIMHRYGIRTSGNIIVGVPQEERSDIFKSIELVRICNPCSLNVNIFTPYCGTALKDVCVQNGYIVENYIHEGRDSWCAVLDLPQISKEEIEGLVRTFALYSTLPMEYYPEIEKCEKFTPGSDKIFDELSDVFWEIMRKRGINYDIPGYDDARLLQKRKLELQLRSGYRRVGWNEQ